MAPRFGKNITHIDPAVIEYLENYDWPGNVRELQNVVERILVVSDSSHLTVENLPQEIVNVVNGQSRSTWKGQTQQTQKPLIVPQTYSDRNSRKLLANNQEKEQIVKALDECGGNVSKAAKMLGISRNTMYRKMKRYSIVN